MSTDTAPADTEAQSARYYGFSALLSGFAKMWRATVPAVLMIVLNAIVQASLIAQNPQVGWTAQFILPLIGSVVMFLLTGAVLAAGAFESATGRVSLGLAVGRARRNFVRFALWVVLQTVVVTIGYMFYSWPGAVLAWVTAYIPIAAIDDTGNPLANNFAAIGRHPFRWIITGAIIGFLLFLGFVLGALNTFFISGPLAALIAGLVGGLFGWWYLTTWACLYRSRNGT